MDRGRRRIAPVLGWLCGLALALVAGGCGKGSYEVGPIAAGIVRLDASLADGAGTPTGTRRITTADGVGVWLLTGGVAVDSTVTIMGAYAFSLRDGVPYRTMLRLTPAVTDTSLVFDSSVPKHLVPDTLLLARQGDVVSNPNPFSSQVQLRFTLADPVVVGLRVFTLGGTPVRVMAPQSLPAGTHSVTWDGTSNLGATVPNGSYWIILTTPSETRADLVLKEP